MPMGKDARTERAVSIDQIVGILATYCAMGEFTILTPSIAAFSHHFAGTPTTTIMFANSITGIVSVPVSILSGMLLPKVGFKRAAIIGIIVMSLGGAYPFLLADTQNYLFVIASRIVVGAGLGIMFPVGSATIIALFEGARRSRLLGLGTTVQFVFALIYTTVAGALTEIAWNYSFLTYLIGLIPLIAVVAFMPEVRDAAASVREVRMKRPCLGEPFPPAMWGYAAFALALWTCVTTVQVVTSTVFDVRGLAGPAEAALVINCCGLGSIACGLVFPHLVRAFGLRLFGVSAALAAMGVAPCLLAQAPAVYAVGLFLLGFGGTAFFTGAQNAVGNIVPKDRVSFASGVMTAVMSLGPFISPYLFAASMAAVPAMGVDAVYPVLIAIAAGCAAIGLAHPMRAVAVEPADRVKGASGAERKESK